MRSTKIFLEHKLYLKIKSYSLKMKEGHFMVDNLYHSNLSLIHLAIIDDMIDEDSKCIAPLKILKRWIMFLQLHC